MFFECQYPLTAYQDVSLLCDKGHIVLVRNMEDGNLYVKKQLQCYNPEVYLQLQQIHVKNTPEIYGLYIDGTRQGTDARVDVKIDVEGLHKENTSNNVKQMSRTLGINLTIIEEYFAGSTLAEILEEGHIFTEEETIDISMQLCQILMDLHGMTPPVIHRDIKPSNILISPEGNVKLLDFDAAKVGYAGRNKDTVLMGTAGFAAPEQYGFSPSSPQTDIYAVGVLMNLLLCRRLPAEKLVEGKLKRIIRCCLEVNPKDRYRNVGELYRALRRACHVKVEWLPPGFRTLKMWKMVIGAGGYVFIIAIVMSATEKSFETRLELFNYRVGFFLICFLIILFYSNYMNVRRWFPLMRSQKKGLRLLGIVISPVIIFWVIMIVVTVLEKILLV